MDVFETENVRLLVEALTSASCEEECRCLLEDLLTSKELLSIAQRLAVAQLLRRDIRYADIAEQTGASSATIVRVNHCLRYGSGGYETILKKLEN